jgi:hypothetical protein
VSQHDDDVLQQSGRSWWPRQRRSESGRMAWKEQMISTAVGTTQGLTG